MCDPSGLVLSHGQVEASDVYGALAEANRRVSAIAATLEGEAPGRIDVADQDGRTIARLLWSEATAAMV